MHDVVIVGGGVIGLAIARELATDRSVLVLDRGVTGAGASWAAAGMLSPLSEADNPGAFFQLCQRSAELYEGFAADLLDETGIDSGFIAQGVLSLASSDESMEILQRRYQWQHQTGFNVQLLSPDQVRRNEPLLTLDVHGGLLAADESSVSPRQLVDALRESCVRRGVRMRMGSQVDGVEMGRLRLGEEILEADTIVIASGVWSGQLQGLDPALPLNPRKGQILSLGIPSGAFRHMVRWQHSYFVPRRNGELILGATEEDAGFDRSVTVAGIGQLLREAQEISRHVGSYPILDTWTGLRPATPDRLPVLGLSRIPGVYYATGHYRNGILLAPITAKIIADVVQGKSPIVDIAPFSPLRGFAQA